MRHGHGLRKLNRTSSHRLAMLRNMSNSLLAPRAHQDHAAEGEGTAARGRAADHARQGADGGQPPLAFQPAARREMVVKLFDELGRATRRATAATRAS